MKKILLPLLLLLTYGVNAQGWKVTTKTDPMTDNVSSYINYINESGVETARIQCDSKSEGFVFLVLLKKDLVSSSILGKEIGQNLVVAMYRVDKNKRGAIKGIAYPGFFQITSENGLALQMKKGNVLRFRVTADDINKTEDITIPLNGFTKAYNSECK
jgi:hypothetical protein